MVKSLTFKPMKNEPCILPYNPNSTSSNELIKIDDDKRTWESNYNSINNQQSVVNNFDISPHNSPKISPYFKDPREIPKKIKTKMGKIKYCNSDEDEEEVDEEDEENNNKSNNIYNNYSNIQKKSIFKNKPITKKFDFEEKINYSNTHSKINLSSNNNQIREYKTSEEDMNRIIQSKKNFVSIKFKCEKDSGWLFLENIVSR